MLRILLLIILFFVGSWASVGKIAALVGTVEVERGGQTLKANVGFGLDENDIIHTAPKSRAQLYMSDRTIVTVGQESEFKIETYFFDGDPQNSANNASFSLVKGAFKTITGKIGKIAPDAFKVKTRTATIGIRGTQFMGESNPHRDTVACTDGSISVTVPGRGEFVLVDAGQITFIESGASPTPPRAYTPGELRSLTRSAGGGTQSELPAAPKETPAAVSGLVEEIEGIVPVEMVQGAELVLRNLWDDLLSGDVTIRTWYAYMGSIYFDDTYFAGYSEPGYTYTSSLTLLPSPNDYFDWGIRTEHMTYDYSIYMADYLDEPLEGTATYEEVMYIIQGTVPATTSADLSLLSSSQNTQFTYVGSMLGGAYTVADTGDLTFMGNITPGSSSVSIDVDFGTSSVIGGTINYTTDQGQGGDYTLLPSSGNVATDLYGNATLDYTGYTDSGAVVLDGEFFGTSAEGLGGTVTTTGFDGVVSTGVFATTQGAYQIEIPIVANQTPLFAPRR